MVLAPILAGEAGQAKGGFPPDGMGRSTRFRSRSIFCRADS